jgi:hypothetical protein
MLAWRCAIIAASLAQLAAGVACWYLAAEEPELARFGLAVCLVVGALGLVGQGTTFLRPAAIGANALFALVFVPGLLGRIVIRLVACVDSGLLPPGIDTRFDTDLFAAGMVAGPVVSALGLRRLSAGCRRDQAEPSRPPEEGRS